MTKVVDASVVLAGLLREEGGDILDRTNEVFHLSALNLGEVYTKVAERGGAIEDVDKYRAPLRVRVRRLRQEHAVTIGELRLPARHLGLSIGDRSCFALGRLLALPVLTAERRWAKLDIGVDIRLIR